MILTLKVSENEEYTYELNNSIYSFAVRGVKLINNTDLTQVNDLSLQIMVVNEKATLQAKAVLYTLFANISKIDNIEKVALLADDQTLLFDSNLLNFKIKGFNFTDRTDQNDPIDFGCNIDIMFEFNENN